jgi:hypothetical protein
MLNLTGKNMIKILNAATLAIAATLAVIVLTPAKSKAAEFKWHTDPNSGRESGYVCADTVWGIRDGAGRVVGHLAPKECMEIKSYHRGSGFITVRGGKSGLDRILLLDKVSDRKATNFWHSCSDQTIELVNKMR